MGFLPKLWDETLASPPPETGLGKLRKFDSFSATRSPPMVEPHDDNHHHQVPVTRSITILRTNSNFKNPSVDSGSAPVSPAGSSTPGTPFTPGTPGLDFKKITRRKPSAAKLERDESSPSAYDWEEMSLLLDVKFAAQILSLVILIITLILALRKFTTNNNGTQMLAGGDGVTSSNQDNIQITALNVNTV